MTSKEQQAAGVALIVYYLQAKFPSMLITKYDVTTILRQTKLPCSLADTTLLQPEHYKQLYARTRYYSLGIKNFRSDFPYPVEWKKKTSSVYAVFELKQNLSQYLPKLGDSEEDKLANEAMLLNEIACCLCLSSAAVQNMVPSIKAAIKQYSCPGLCAKPPVYPEPNASEEVTDSPDSNIASKASHWSTLGFFNGYSPEPLAGCPSTGFLSDNSSWQDEPDNLGKGEDAGIYIDSNGQIVTEIPVMLDWSSTYYSLFGNSVGDEKDEVTGVDLSALNPIQTR